MLKDGSSAMPVELWVRWLWDLHPGHRSERDVGAFIDAVARGLRPLKIIDNARIYARLMRSQHANGCVTVERWLDGERRLKAADEEDQEGNEEEGDEP